MTTRHPTAWHPTSFASVCLTHVVKVLSRAFLFIAILILAAPLPAQAKPPFPVIFVHGLLGNIDSWSAFGSYLDQSGWIFGGFPTIDKTTGQISTAIQPGDFYIMQFSDNKNLSFVGQGIELDHIIQEVVALNPGKTKVILVGHSMGGLAARANLQRFPSHNANVAQLITVGTPHQGANPLFLTSLISAYGFSDIPEAVRELDPNNTASTALADLNDLTTWPLPKSVSYVSIVANEINLLGFQDTDDDGVVPTDSQDLSNVAGFSTLNLPHSFDPITVDAHLECQFKIFDVPIPIPPLVGEAHTCETSDQGVWAKILHEINTLNTAPQGWLDAPPANTSVSGPVSVWGWAIDRETPSGSLTFTLLIDNAPASPTFTRFARPDVCAAYPESRYPESCQSGFSTTWTPTGLSGAHTLAVRVTDGSGQSSTIGPVPVTVSQAGTTPPSAFTLSAATQCNGSSPMIVLSGWGSSGFTTFDVYRNGSLYSPANTGSTFSNYGSNVTAGTTYSYYVIAKNASGETQSNTVTVTAPTSCGGTPPPGSFTLFTPTKDCPGKVPAIHLNWSASTGADHYDLYRDGSLYPAGAGNITTSFTNTGSNVSFGSTYSYFVRAVGSTGMTRDSNQVSTQATCVVTVGGTGGIDLKLRTCASTNDAICPVITKLSDGTVMTIVGGPVAADGFNWYAIQGAAGTGWSAGDWLIP